MLNDVEIQGKMLEALYTIAPEIRGINQIPDNSNLQETFDLDSVDLVRYLAKLEEFFSISLAGDSYRSFLTIKDGMEVLKMKLDKA